MLNITRRNRKIFHIIEYAISDFCKVLDCESFRKDESILVTYDGEDLFFVFPEFSEDKYQLDINSIVYSDLPTSKAAKLREIYRSDEINDYTEEAGVGLWFIKEKTLVTSCILEKKYSDYALLKSRLLLDMYINVQNARKLKDKLDVLLAELEQVSVN